MKQIGLIGLKKEKTKKRFFEKCAKYHQPSKFVVVVTSSPRRSVVKFLTSPQRLNVNKTKDRIMSLNLTDGLNFLKEKDEKKSYKKHKEKESDFLDTKKRKKEKKSKKERKKSKHKIKRQKTSWKHSSASERDSDSDSDSDSKEEEEKMKLKRGSDNDQGILDFALFSVSDKMRGKKPDDKNRSIIDKPGQSQRELNPYWKDGGTGLPKQKESTENKPRRLNFKKPSDESFRSFFEEGERKGNWKKKNPSEEIEPCFSEKPRSKVEISEGKIFTDSELNRLAAKVVKAEILGDRTLVEKLKSELEEAKKRRARPETEPSLPRERTETIILTKTNRQGFTVPADVPTGRHSTGSSSRRKKHKVETHESGQRQRYFPDDDKYSLKEMFVKEKATTREEEERATIKNLAKGSRKPGRGDDEEEEGAYLDRARYEESDEKGRTESVNEAKRKQKSLEGCKWCLENKNKSKHLIVEIGKKCYLSLPEETSLTEGHCLIVPIYHTPSGTATDEDVWEEMETMRKKLVDMFSETGKEPIFFENARGLNRFPHMVLHCVPVDKEEGDLAPIYFKKALLESETEWSNNKKVVDLKTKGLRKSIPKGLPYFAVDFGREGGFAHVIEDERLFPTNFAQEIIGGMLDLDHRIWRKHQKQDFNSQREKFFKFTKTFRNYNSGFRKREDSSSSTD